MFKEFWDKTKAFFKDSLTIFIARATAVIGLITTVVGSMDWSPLLNLGMSTGFNKTQLISIGIMVFVQGLFVELARRRTL